MDPKKITLTIVTNTDHLDEVVENLQNALDDFVLEDGIASLDGDIQIS